jgi:hypothetical protein
MSEPEIPVLDDLPTTVCRVCGVPKINGLFTPFELQTLVRCRVCIGEMNIKARPRPSHVWHRGRP